MRFRTVSLEHFRNIDFAQVDLSAARIFFVGNNGQGKTNLLEALGLVTALRSFRTSNTELLVQQSHATARLFFRIEQTDGEETVQIEFHREKKTLLLNDNPVKRFSDFIGQFPVVILSSNDVELVRDGPGVRRRYLDLTLSATDRRYFTVLRDYHKALAERNQVLKNNGSEAQLSAFEHVMLPFAEYIYAARKRFIDWLENAVSKNYRTIAPEENLDISISYYPSHRDQDAESIRGKWKNDRTRERLLKTTQSGPQRDDFNIQIGGLNARDCASEGQQRSIAVAFRLSQLDYFEKVREETPILLIDDVVGELDPKRRERFWQMLSPETQVIATGTMLPGNDSQDWLIYDVTTGTFRRR